MPDQIVFAPEESRAARRHKTFEPTVMRIGLTERRVHIINLSVGGALVHASEPPPRDADVRLLIGALWRRARVAWVGGSRFGVAFRGMMHEHDLAPLLADHAVALA